MSVNQELKVLYFKKNGGWGRGEDVVNQQPSQFKRAFIKELKRLYY